MRNLIAAGVLGLILSAAGAEVPGVGKASAVPARVPVLFVQLKMEPFRGEYPSDTRANIEAFIRGIGYELIGYQDNEAGRHVEIVADAPQGLAQRVQRYLRMEAAARLLRAHPDVRSVRETARGDLSVLFSRLLYEPQIQAAVSGLPEGLRPHRYRNELMEGVWVDLSTAGMSDPKRVAEALARTHQDRIDWAQAVVKVPTFRAEVR